MGQFQDNLKRAAVPVIALAGLAFGSEAIESKQEGSAPDPVPAEQKLSAEELANFDLGGCTFVPPTAPNPCGTKLVIPDGIGKERPAPAPNQSSAK